jgi:hypothetical protein
MGKADATLAPQDRLDPTTLRPYAATTGQIIRQVQGGSGYAGGSAQSASAIQRPILESELAKAQKEGRQEDAAALMRELSRLPGAQSGFSGFAGPADTARAVDQAKADVVRSEGNLTKGGKASDMISMIGRARELLGQGPTGSMIGAAADKVANVFGVATKGDVAAGQLEALSGWLVNNVPRMEGPQSNYDVDNYKVMAGRIGDRTLPIKARLAAADEVAGLQRKYAELNNLSINTGGAVGSWGAQQTAQRKPVAQGMYNGRKVIKYSDGSIDYAN